MPRSRHRFTTLRKSHNRLSPRLCEQSRLLSSAASFGAQPAQFSPEISQSLQGTGIAPVAFLAQITSSHAERRHYWAARTAGSSELPEAA
jgi:hypothetical protein